MKSPTEMNDSELYMNIKSLGTALRQAYRFELLVGYALPGSENFEGRLQALHAEADRREAIEARSVELTDGEITALLRAAVDLDQSDSKLPDAVYTLREALNGGPQAERVSRYVYTAGDLIRV